MKKYLKSMAKKSVSLFLAVIMVLSCWVWMAPEEAKKAEAAAAGYTSYKFTVTYEISNRPYASGHVQYKTSADLGWGAENNSGNYQNHISSFASGTDDDGNNAGAIGTHKVTIDTGTEFPTCIAVRGASQGDGCGDSDLRVKTIQINGKQVWSGSHGFSGAGANDDHTAIIWCGKSTDGSGSNNGSVTGTYTWVPALIAGFEDVGDNKATAGGISATLSEVGGADVKTGAANFDLTKYTYYNQYGVKFSAADGLAYYNAQKFAGTVETTTHISGTSNSDTVTDYSDYIWVDPDNNNQAVISPKLQIANPQGSSGKATFHLVRTYTIKDAVLGIDTPSRVSSEITVTYPQYAVNFDAGLNDVKFTYSGGTEVGKVFSRSGYHGGTIDIPTNAEKAGYTFYGFWTKPQPASGNGNYNALEADFAKPCTTEDYNSYKASGTVNGDIVTDKDGNKWYDAGKPMDPTTAKSIDVAGKVETPNDASDDLIQSWYGWWLSDDLTLKFYDVDGKFLGEKVVKSGQTQGAIAWPASTYVDSGYTTGAFKFKVDGNIWVNTDGEEINKNSYTFTKDLILTPKLTRESFTDKYAVKFTDPNNGSSVAVGTDGNYAYRADIKNYADTALDAIADTPNDVDGALDYSYELLGWSNVKPTTGKNYHVLLEDADFDVNGTSIGLNSDWVVRDAQTYYAVYRRHVKTYVVNFNYKDATGADATRQIKVEYGATLVPPTEYVPYTYVTKGFGYTFDKWSYKTSAGSATLDYAATIPFTSESISIAGTAQEGTANLKPIVIDATYGAPVATPYAVTFNYVDDNGEDKTYNAEVKNEQFITDGIVNNLKPAEKWDDGEAEYTYADQWEITEGAATVGIGGTEVKVGDKISTDDLTGLTPTSNLTFKAVYANPVPFYTVTYVDGAKTVTYRLLQGTNVPEWTEKVTNDNGTPDNMDDDFEEDKIYVPEDYEGEGGIFKFQGWYDEKQTDAELKATNGNKVTAADKVTRNLTLYSQFKFIPDTFDIKFMSYDGKVQLSAGKFEKGQSIESITAVANKAAQGRASDETYDYLFLGWDKPVPTFCEGQDVTFIAQYKPVYRYYDVKWYNSRLVDGNWVADKTTSTVDGKDVETYLLATTHHTYNSKLYTPAVDNLACLETAPAGQNYVFAGWYYNDAQGNAVKYVRGMLVTAEMEFYATYTLTDKVYTVTTVVKGEETDYTVADGKAASLPEPQAGYVSATKHDAFTGWYTDAAYTTEYVVEYDEDGNLVKGAINADTKLYAKFDESDHAYTNKVLKTAPTYYKEGVNEVWCSCSADNTKKDEAIAKLTDTQIPTGTIYLGEKSWSSEGEPAYNTDNDPISIFVNENTDIIITSNDTGDVNDLYNPSGIGKGVKLIRAFAFPAETVLTADNYGAAQQLAIDVYVDNTEALTNNANFAIKLGDVMVADLDAAGNPQYDAEGKLLSKKLQSGESYIIYYYVIDKADNQLNRKVRTAKFLYDNTAPVFTVEGNANTAAVPTYCGDATVTGIEKDVVLTVNGVEVTATFEEGAATGTYKISYAEDVDNVIIVATDKAGNTYSKKIKVNDHVYRVDELASTCTDDGYKKEICITCSHVKTNETYESTGHVMGQPEITPADCTNRGYIVTKCENCDLEIKTEQILDEETGEMVDILPALGHEYAKDENDEIIYTTVTESTCKTKGLAEAVCTVCGEGKQEKILELDPDNHEDISETEILPDCVNNGYYKKSCSCSEEPLVYIDHEDDEKYKALGHGDKIWETIKEANCYQPGTKVEKCSVCTAILTAETAFGYTETADGDYAYVTEIQNEGTEEETEVKITEEIDGKTYYKYYLLPATGEHVKYVTEKVDSVPGTQGHVNYACKTEGCPWTGSKKLDKVEAFTVTFLAEDGKTEITKITKDEGEYIAATEVTAPSKAATKEYTYSFAGWVEVITGTDGKTTDGSTYKLPLEVTKAMTLKASYKATKILYTHTFVVPNEWVSATADEVSTVEFAKLVGGYGDERVPSAVPTFKHKDADEDARLKALYTFEFKGWKNAKGEIVTDFAIADDATFTAYFEAKPIKYDVIFYSGSEVVWTTQVNGGATVTYANIDNNGTEEDTSDDKLILPTKAYDADNHYAFNNKWYTDAACENEYKGTAITEKTRLYAGFTAIAHTYTVNTKVGTVVDEADPEVKDGIIQKADCVLPEITAKICSCGREIEDETKAALGHDEYKRDAEGNHILVDGEKVINGANEEVGADKVIHYVVRCSVCNEVLSSDKVSVTVKFVNYNNNILGRKNYTLNDEIKYEGETPVKADDKENTYTFAGWSIDGDESGKIYTNAQLGKATVDVTFVAQFTASKKYYKVSYVDYNNNLLYNYTVTVEDKVIEGVIYGAALPEYKGTTDPATLTGPDYTEEGHYVFDKWEYDTTYIVKGDVVVHPTFKLVDHEKQIKKTPADCIKAGGDTITCTGCAYHATVNATEPALGHAWGEGVVTTPPVFETQTPGVMTYTCTRCGETKTEEIPGDSYTIKATVKDSNGNPSVGVRVELLRKQDDGSYTYLTHKETDNNGVVIFAGLEKGDYRVYVTNTKTYYDATVNEDGSVKDGDITAQPENKPVDNSCKCSCHKNNFWGTIYRLIQKIIKFFTGKPSCCADPDGRI